MSENWLNQLLGEKQYPDNTHQWVVSRNSMWEERQTVNKNNKDITRVIIEPSILDMDKIGDITTPKIKKFIYRPQTLDEYIGQSSAKELVRMNLKKIELLKPVHFLISGSKGCGKTTLSYIIRNMLHAKMIERIAKQITCNEEVIDLVNEINRSTEKNVILFIDEVHSIDPKLCEIFYPMMEDFKISGKNIRPFILIGATTDKHILVKNNAPFIDRFQVQVELTKYTFADIEAIINQCKLQLYPQYDISNEYIHTVAENSKFTPRIAISLLEDGVIEKDINYVLKCHRILYQGLTETDYSILRILKENNRPIGSKALSQMIGISEKDYNDTYENYLVEQEYIIKGCRGREISAKGKEVCTIIESKLK
jgi:holliday junction DNA helicase RuvB